MPLVDIERREESDRGGEARGAAPLPRDGRAAARRRTQAPFARRGVGRARRRNGSRTAPSTGRAPFRTLCATATARSEVTFTPDLRVARGFRARRPERRATRTHARGGRAEGSRPNRRRRARQPRRHLHRPRRRAADAHTHAARRLERPRATSSSTPYAATPTPAALELHVAWEVAAGGGRRAPLVYVDAVTGEVLGTEER